MYGGQFRQQFGWYVGLHCLELGLYGGGTPRRFIPELCPQEILDLVEVDGVTMDATVEELTRRSSEANLRRMRAEEAGLPSEEFYSQIVAANEELRA
jgi:hypothetical protein